MSPSLPRTVLVLPLLLLVACKSCRKEPVSVPTHDLPPPAPIEDAPKQEIPSAIVEMTRNFDRVLFEYDAATLTADGKQSLSANAAIMQQYPDIKLEIQGHADERGSTDYNLALGQKRSDAVVQYLLAVGVSSSRVKSVSYGEERPLDGRSAETAWTQNRRAEFAITWSGSAPVRGTVN